MAKKLFFHRRHKLPPWAQIYSVWGVLAAVTLVLLFFTSIEQVAPTKTSVAPTSARAFSQTLFYDLREADSNESFDVLYTYAKQLASRGNFKLTQEKKADCAIVRLTRGSDDKHSLTAAVTGDKTQAAFHLLSFLEYTSAHRSGVALDASLIFKSTRCSLEEAIRQVQQETNAPLVELNVGSTDTHYNRIGALKNLQARTSFESAFLSPERTLWANIMATTAADNEAVFQLPVKATWNKNPDAQVAENPLWHHPALAKEKSILSTIPVALYLSAHTQLYNGGFTVLMVLLWLLALLPFVNAVGTFKERLNVGAALTSTVLYALAFFIYLLVTKALLSSLKSDTALIALLVVLLLIIFVPLRLAQKAFFREELNRAGVHFWILFFLTIALFVNPIVALFGGVFLMLLSAFHRVGLLSKTLRIVSIVLLVFWVVLIATKPFGSFANYLSALLPHSSAVGVLKLSLAAFVGGGLVSLVFVPRERN